MSRRSSAHNTAAAPSMPASTPAPNLTGVAAAFGEDTLRDSVKELSVATEGLSAPSVCVATDETLANGFDEIVSSEVVLAEDSDPVDVIESDAGRIGVGVGVGVSVDVLDTSQASKLTLTHPICVTAIVTTIVNIGINFILLMLAIGMVLRLIANRSIMVTTAVTMIRDCKEG
ncbi:hypothetical protein F4813DRAFT_370037 [Daldinia decipiens]|uniref:uncharacterized protein n=1 Tax=Daldinia decipiens TaxID=326647 RepID=UPI0020C374EB|nr:uncharacterized protein F4813DRAFT_370037 [Daldinia decipiens]KAI1654720.1 hypothetical protein F4813DRAFT_370037 [Daldinia decipiens]